MKIFLIGYMGSGKTTIGRPLAKALGVPFFDADHVISGRYSQTIAEIFASMGEEKFREIERDTLKELSTNSDFVISTGGGAPCFHDNMEAMNAAGTTVYLRLSPGGLAKRLEHGADKRPLLRGKSPEELLAFIAVSLEQRRRYYEQAKITVDCDGYGDTQIIDRIVKILNITN